MESGLSSGLPAVAVEVLTMVFQVLMQRGGSRSGNIDYDELRPESNGRGDRRVHQRISESRGLPDRSLSRSSLRE